MIDIPFIVNVMLGVCAGIMLFYILKIPIYFLTGTRSSVSMISGELEDIRRALEKLDAIEGQLGLIRWELENFRGQCQYPGKDS